MKVVEEAMNSVVRESVMKCASWYGFNGMEALRMLSQEEVVEKRKKSKVEAIVLPFVGELVREDGCNGLCYNRGLFTQCPKAKMEVGSYCKTCSKEASGSESGKPLLGTVEDRMSSDAMEFRDPKGRAPVAYSRIMSQLGLSRDTVEAEASRLGVTIAEEHFATEKKRGRPPVEKKRKAQAETVEDLLSRMVTESDESDESYEVNSQADTVVMSENEDAEDAESAEKEAISNAETFLKETAQKEGKLAAQKAEKEAKAAKLAEDKAEKEAKLAAEKAEKEAKLAAQKAEKEAKQAALAAEKEAKQAALAAEKEAKQAALAAEKEAKQAALAAEKEAKAAKLLAEKEAKAAKPKAEKEAKPKAEKEAKPKAEKEAKPKAQKQAKPKESAAEAASAAPVEAEPKPKKVTVTRITIEGVEYLKTAENLLYNPQTKEEMGIYDPETKTIKPLPEESDDELDEEDYESDAN